MTTLMTNRLSLLYSRTDVLLNGLPSSVESPTRVLLSCTEDMNRADVVWSRQRSLQDQAICSVKVTEHECSYFWRHGTAEKWDEGKGTLENCLATGELADVLTKLGFTT